MSRVHLDIDRIIADTNDTQRYTSNELAASSQGMGIRDCNTQIKKLFNIIKSPDSAYDKLHNDVIDAITYRSDDMLLATITKLENTENRFISTGKCTNENKYNKLSAKRYQCALSFSAAVRSNRAIAAVTSPPPKNPTNPYGEGTSKGGGHSI